MVRSLFCLHASDPRGRQRAPHPPDSCIELSRRWFDRPPGVRRLSLDRCDGDPTSSARGSVQSPEVPILASSGGQLAGVRGRHLRSRVQGLRNKASQSTGSPKRVGLSSDGYAKAVGQSCWKDYRHGTGGPSGLLIQSALVPGHSRQALLGPGFPNTRGCTADGTVVPGTAQILEREEVVSAQSVLIGSI